MRKGQVFCKKKKIWIILFLFLHKKWEFINFLVKFWVWSNMKKKMVHFGWMDLNLLGSRFLFFFFLLRVISFLKSSGSHHTKESSFSCSTGSRRGHFLYWTSCCGFEKRVKPPSWKITKNTSWRIARSLGVCPGGVELD